MIENAQVIAVKDLKDNISGHLKVIERGARSLVEAPLAGAAEI
jgi:hypothetical protein